MSQWATARMLVVFAAVSWFTGGCLATSPTDFEADGDDVGATSAALAGDGPSRRVRLKAKSNNRYISGGSIGTAVQALRIQPEPFDLISNSDGTVSFRSQSNYKLISAENAGADSLVANRNEIGAWEKFRLTNSTDGYSVLQSVANNKYVTFYPDPKPARAVATAIGDWEKFTIIESGERFVTFSAYSNHKYLTASGAGTGNIYNSAPWPDSWENFYLINNDDGTISLRSEVSGNFVSAENAGQAPLVANRRAIGAWEKFYLETSDGYDRALRSVANNKYVTFDITGNIAASARSSTLGPWEKVYMALGTGSGNTAEYNVVRIDSQPLVSCSNYQSVDPTMAVPVVGVQVISNTSPTPYNCAERAVFDAVSPDGYYLDPEISVDVADHSRMEQQPTCDTVISASLYRSSNDKSNWFHIESVEVKGSAASGGGCNPLGIRWKSTFQGGLYQVLATARYGNTLLPVAITGGPQHGLYNFRSSAGLSYGIYSWNLSVTKRGSLVFEGLSGRGTQVALITVRSGGFYTSQYPQKSTATLFTYINPSSSGTPTTGVLYSDESGNVTKNTMPSNFFSIAAALSSDVAASPALSAYSDCTAKMLSIGSALAGCVKALAPVPTPPGWIVCAGAAGTAAANYIGSACWNELINWGASDVYAVYSGGLRVSLEDQEPACDFGNVRSYSMVGVTPVRSCVPQPFTCGDGSAPGPYPQECTRSCGTGKHCTFIGVPSLCAQPCFLCMECQ